MNEPLNEYEDLRTDLRRFSHHSINKEGSSTV